MTLGEWQQKLSALPATPNQVGAVRREFERLGFGPGDRADRLRITAQLVGLAEVGSTRDLAMGDAGRLLRQLRDVADRAELAELLPRPAAPRPRLRDALQVLAEVVAELTMDPWPSSSRFASTAPGAGTSGQAAPGGTARSAARAAGTRSGSSARTA